MNLGPGTQSLGLEHLSLDNKCAVRISIYRLREECLDKLFVVPV